MAKRPTKKTPQKNEVLVWVISGADNLKQMTCQRRTELERVIRGTIRFVYDVTKRAVHVICGDQATHLRIGQILAAAGFACQEQRVYTRTATP